MKPLNKKLTAKWLENQVEFLKPLVLFVAGLYFVPLITLLSQEAHSVSLADFKPSSAVITAIVLYLVNAIYDYVRKWASK